ncbi:vesicle-associated membrane protein 3-like [Liolophura sinensis]|uniref:vesicle-associated membrane protein 3-like n=1 Tax=Liolophura sinensis TaxID=3198878 RepID=UPI003158E4CF
MACNVLVDENIRVTDEALGDAIDGGSIRVPELISQVDELTEILRSNTQRLMEREGRLEDLQILADDLSDKAHQFQTVTKRARRKIWWRRNKYRALTVLFIIIVIVVIITVVILVVALRVV